MPTRIAGWQIKEVVEVKNFEFDESLWRIKIRTKRGVVFPYQKDTYLTIIQFQEEGKEVIRDYIKRKNENDI